MLSNGCLYYLKIIEWRCILNCTFCTELHLYFGATSIFYTFGVVAPNVGNDLLRYEEFGVQDMV
jgi:hypothetical protein